MSSCFHFAFLKTIRILKVCWDLIRKVTAELQHVSRATHIHGRQVPFEGVLSLFHISPHGTRVLGKVGGCSLTVTLCSSNIRMGEAMLAQT